MKRILLVLVLLAGGMGMAQTIPVNQTRQTKYQRYTLRDVQVSYTSVVLNFEVSNITKNWTYFKLATSGYIKDSTGMKYKMLSYDGISKSQTSLKAGETKRFSITIEKPQNGAKWVTYTIPSSMTFDRIPVQVPFQVLPHGVVELQGDDTYRYDNAALSLFNTPNIVANMTTLDLSKFSGTIGDNALRNCTALRHIIVGPAATVQVEAALGAEGARRLESVIYVAGKPTAKTYRICYYAGEKGTEPYKIINTFNGDRASLPTVQGMATRTYSNGTYYGQMTKERREGRGIMQYSDGTVQMGEWQGDLYKGSPEVITLEDFLAFPAILPLDLIAKRHVESSINEWQKKGEYEKTADWRKRVNTTTRQQKADQLYKQLVDRYVKNACAKSKLDLTLGQYDADNETYLVTDTKYGQMVVSLAAGIMPQRFKAMWNTLVPVPTYHFNGSEIEVVELEFYNGLQLMGRYSIAAGSVYRLASIDYNFTPIEIDLDNTTQHRTTSAARIDTARLSALPEVDINIPRATVPHPTTYAFIIANEDYPSASVPYALNDGRVFRDYCIKRLGISTDHITLMENATGGNIIACVEMIKQASVANDGDVDILVYYAGHAFPDEATKDAYLLPVDGDSRYAATAYSLGRLYNELGQVLARSIVCFIDACFSGATREDGMLLAGRGVAIKANAEAPLGRTVVFTASSDAETAHSYEQKRHGLFTYFLLKYMQEHPGDITLGAMSEYVEKQVKRTSHDVNRKMQTPTVIPSVQLQGSWQDIRL